MDTARVGATVPDKLKHDLMVALASERMKFTEWLIKQMQRTVDDYREMRGGQ